MVALQAFPEMSVFFCVLTGYEFTLCFQQFRYLKAYSKAHTNMTIFLIIRSEKLLLLGSDTFLPLIICYKEKSFGPTRSYFINITY